jgi:hypothetical protein
VILPIETRRKRIIVAIIFHSRQVIPGEESVDLFVIVHDPRPTAGPRRWLRVG